MRIFRKKQQLADFSIPDMKDTMKMFGLEPGTQARDLFHWTEKDDIENQEVALGKRKWQLSEMKASGATLREIMALEISIKGTENWLKENKPT